MNKNILAFVHSLLHTFSKLETLDCKPAVILGLLVPHWVKNWSYSHFDCDCKIK